LVLDAEPGLADEFHRYAEAREEQCRQEGQRFAGLREIAWPYVASIGRPYAPGQVPGTSVPGVSGSPPDQDPQPSFASRVTQRLRNRGKGEATHG
jgi:hypothetical protein